MRNIALAGQMGAGKTTVANYLEDNYEYESIKISAAIYEIAVRIWGVEARKDRAKLQDLGTKIREIDPDAWLNCYIRDLKSRNDDITRGGCDPGDFPVVNDTLRFPNEYWALKEADFVLIKVNVPESVRVDRLQKIGRIQDLDRLHHESETALFGARAEAEGIHFDLELNNDTDLDNMELEVRNLINRIEGEE